MATESDHVLEGCLVTPSILKSRWTLKMVQSIRLIRRIPGLRFIVVLSEAILVCGSFSSLAWAQPIPANPSPAADALVTEPSAEEKIDPAHAENLILQLGASTFAEREKAGGEILRIGMPMVPFLREAVKTQGDRETVLRARSALSQLTSGNFEARVAEFLTGRDVGASFDGWQTIEATLGDTPAIREIFIEILRVHPNLIASLDGTTRERTVAIDQTAQLIQVNMFQHHQFPTLADCVALLLPLVDPGVTVSGGYESTLVSVLQKQMSALRRDASLWGPISRLIDQWVSRSRIENRNDVLWYAMQWDLSAGAALGIRTLSETTDIETLQTAMQAIARFGVVEDAKLLAKFVDDDRPAATRMPVIIGDDSLRVTVGDAALAAIAVLYKVPLQELGMKHGELHGKVAFLVDNAGYLPDQAADRAAAQKTVRGWLNGVSPQAKPRS